MDQDQLFNLSVCKNCNSFPIIDASDNYDYYFECPECSYTAIYNYTPTFFEEVFGINLIDDFGYLKLLNIFSNKYLKDLSLDLESIKIDDFTLISKNKKTVVYFLDKEYHTFEHFDIKNKKQLDKVILKVIKFKSFK